MIANHELLKSQENDLLNENLLEHHDFLALSKRIHERLKEWYGEDFTIMRTLKKDLLQKDLKVLDLYPEKQKENRHLSKMSQLLIQNLQNKNARLASNSVLSATGSELGVLREKQPNLSKSTKQSATNSQKHINVN